MKPSSRSVITATDQRTGKRGVEPLHTLTRYRRVGDNVQVIA
ncbi:MAG: hypothetical protein U1E76_28350 [Planctomycetota bacterium]